MNIKSGILILASLSLLAGCASVPVRVTQGEVGGAATAPAGAATNEAEHSSQWARVLPAPVVNQQPLAMVEYNSEYERNNAALGVVTGPAGQPMSYYASPEAPSLYWQYQFTLPTNSNTVTVFGRPADVYSRPYGYYIVH
ncbi:MAG: hypothetical protein U0573_05575 [Phycisphaerales bacterium]|nr:hypothetical protein [Planctomycetota bacterium]